eukprot:326762_1
MAYTHHYPIMKLFNLLIIFLTSTLSSSTSWGPVQIKYSDNDQCASVDAHYDLYINDCNGESNQLWSMDNYGFIMNQQYNNLCLTADGMWPKLKDCTIEANQIWTLTSSDEQNQIWKIINSENCLIIGGVNPQHRVTVQSCGIRDEWVINISPQTENFGQRSYIFCPESLGSDVSYKQDNDYGLNIFARTAKGSEYAQDCFLRYSRSFASEVDAEIVVNNFINPNDNIVVFIHGWQPSFDNKFVLPDQWNAQIHDTCTVWPESNQGGLEPCPPTDHDAQFWIKNGFNVIHLDWRQYAAEPMRDPMPSGAQFAEKKIYTPIYNGKNVVELLYEKLVAVLDMVNWNGDELRIAGNSLGAQVTMKLAVEFKLHSVYANKLRRIALLDAYFSPEEFDYFSPKSSTGNIALSEYLPILRNADVPVLIENYRTTVLPQILMNENTELNKRTIFVELKPLYYPVEATAGKHVAALAIYEHCMKFTGPLDKNAPSCRMSTQEMQWMSDTIWCPDQKNGGTAPCSYTFVQRASIDDPTAYTTWDTDDKFDRNGWPNYFIYANHGGYVAEATLTYINSNNKDEKYGPYHASVGLPIEFFIPRDATGIFIFANAVGGVGIFSKYYPTSQEIYWCDQFDVMGTTLITDYANVAGGTKHCYDIGDSFKYRINNKGAYVVGTTLTYTKSNNEYVTEYQDASVGFSNEFFIPPNSKWIKITVNAILGAQIFEKYYQTQQEINWCNNFDVSGIIWGEDYTNVAGGSKTCYDYS